MQCAAPVYNEHRSRFFGAGTYFRSINQSQAENDISLEITYDPATNTDTLTVRVYDPTHTTTIATESYSVTAGTYNTTLQTCSINDIDSLRQAVGYVQGTGSYTIKSSYIEMVPRGTDINDSGTDTGCLGTLVETFMTGGEGAPADGSTINTIRTGPNRTIIINSTIENYNGSSSTPPTSKKIQQWDGTEWIPYCNNTPGQCPGNNATICSP